MIECLPVFLTFIFLILERPLNSRLHSFTPFLYHLFLFCGHEHNNGPVFQRLVIDWRENDLLAWVIIGKFLILCALQKAGQVFQGNAKPLADGAEICQIKFFQGSLIQAVHNSVIWHTNLFAQRKQSRVIIPEQRKKYFFL